MARIRAFLRAVASGVAAALLLAAAACGGQDASPSGAAATTVPAPTSGPAAPVEAAEAPAAPPEAPPSPEAATPDALGATEEDPAATGEDPGSAGEDPAAPPAPQPPATTEATDAAASAAEAPPSPEAATPEAAEVPAATGEGAAALQGRWEGGIEIAGPADLPFAVDLTASGGGLRGTIDLQGFYGLALSNVTLEAGRLRFELESPLGLAVWDGAVGDGVIEGEFTQAGMAETFWMQRFEDPDTDGAAAAFGREEMEFSNGDVVLAGELVLPEGDGPHPAVVLISGSGEQDRDSNLGGFRMFAVLADHLAEAGVASLRFDDRGVGGSGGQNLKATLQDRAGDVEAAVDLLRSRDDIDAAHVGLIGHSEGGIVAPVVANRTDAVAFVAILASPTLLAEEVIAAQQLALLEESGATAEEFEQFRALQELAFRAVATGQGWDEVEASIRAQIQQQFEAFSEEMRETIPDEEALVDSIVAEQLATWRSPWFASFLGYDPRPAIVALEVPMIALYGELDTQVPAAANSIAMSETIATSNVPSYTIATVFSANHLFQEAVTGSVREYPRLKREFAPDFLEILTQSLREVIGS